MNRDIPPDPGSAAAWLMAADRAEVRADLEAVYSLAADQITQRGPACWASGRCCNFVRTGHRLYVTGLEAAYVVRALGGRPDETALDAAESRGDCPYLASNLCGIHAIKPLGCRVYFCDRSAEEWQQILSERCLSLIRVLHEKYGVEYRYGEWRAMLRLFPSTVRAAGAGGG